MNRGLACCDTADKCGQFRNDFRLGVQCRLDLYDLIRRETEELILCQHRTRAVESRTKYERRHVLLRQLRCTLDL